ncbi:hypothetical protein ASPZODRAFT_63042 [Penicilliopsis zonata CBS 506.65]|uniref:Translation machinery-associated protein 16 n=1 Tax=Penicilliopsis zonata CBS 506.65 TaxID=1073090 RepID=A0A1L9SNH6_9EURO|nr:hypothetical protein ASPZODRAFT_63042 [Penicilliopsis zonata CBS 506.65]OJJ48661.1 hypothetical protein ASPZODRAFT_63042 [Penicilliopsis zonata CBS 506.65]
MPRSLQKVQKHIAKKRGVVEALHENSRDAKLLRRAGARDDRLSRIASVMSRARRSYVDRVNYFLEALGETPALVSEDGMKELVVRYIARDAEEIEQLQKERRKGRPPSKREEALSQRTEAENKEYKTGFWMPDLSNQDNIRNLSLWNGDWSSLVTVKFVRLVKDGSMQASSFPPNGLS